MKFIRPALIVLAIVLLLTSIHFGTLAYDKYTNYYSSETYSRRNINAYVGGDAYNYIINGTYFTAFSTLCGFTGLGALLSLLAALFLHAQIENNHAPLSGALPPSFSPSDAPRS